MPRKPLPTEFALADSTSPSKIAALLRLYAKKSGWPRASYYDESSEWTTLLRQVPDSFLSEKVERSCPTHYPPEIAAFDLVPELLELGHAGKYLVFGYGRKWRAMGDSVDSAIAQLRNQFPYQLAHPHWVHVTPALMGCRKAEEYLWWKKSSRTSHDLVENTISQLLLELWSALPPHLLARSL